MKKILSLILVFAGLFVLGLHEVNAEVKTVPFEVDILLDGENQAKQELDGEYGGTYSLDTLPEGYEFEFWVVNGFKKDYAADHEFLITENMKLQAVFTKDKHAVLFVDTNGKLVKALYVSNAETILAPEVQLSKPGYVLSADAWKDQNGQSLASEATESLVYTAQYERANDTLFDVLVVGAEPNDPTGEYKLNAVVIAEASIEDFTHWEEDGKVVSYDKNYAFTVVQDREIEAKTGGTVQPLVTMTTNLELRDGHETYLGQFFLPEGYELVEYGFLGSDKVEVLTHETNGVTVIPSNNYNAMTKEFVRSFVDGTFVSLRAYVVAKYEGELVYVYSDRNQVSYQSYIFDSGFEDSTKGSYSSADITINGHDFTLSDALIGSDNNDKKNGSKSVRIQNTGYILSKEKFSKLTQITLTYGEYGTDGDATLNIDVSTDGTNWVNIGTENITSAFVTKSFNIPQNLLDKELFIKVSKTGGKRVNIDDLKFSSMLNTNLYEINIRYDDVEVKNFVGNNGYLNTDSINKVGHNLVGLFSDQEFTKPFNLSTPIKEHLNLYAKWEKNTYTVIFNTNGGSQVTRFDVLFGEQIARPENPTKEHYTFDGWYLNEELTGEEYVFGTMPANDVRLYAKWVLNNYTISFNTMGGNEIADLVAPYLSEIHAPENPTFEDKVFVGWYLNEELVGEQYVFNTMPGENITLYAKWADASETVEVTFDLNYEGSPKPEVISHISGELVTMPVEPTRDGYTFLGWYIDENGQNSFNENESISQNITIYAKWEILRIESILIQSDFGTTDKDGSNNFTTQFTHLVNNGSLDPNGSGTKSWNFKGAGFNGAQWDYIRMGGKAASTLEGAQVFLGTNFKVEANISKIEIDIVALDSATGDEIIYLQTADSLTGTWTNVTNQKTFIGTLTFENLNISNKYIRFVIVRGSTGSNNKGTDIKTITFYGFPQ